MGGRVFNWFCAFLSPLISLWEQCARSWTHEGSCHVRWLAVRHCVLQRENPAKRKWVARVIFKARNVCGCFQCGAFFLPVLKALVSVLAFKNEERTPSVFVFLILSEVLIDSAFYKRNDSVKFYSLALAWVVRFIDLLHFYFAQLVVQDEDSGLTSWEEMGSLCL